MITISAYESHPVGVFGLGKAGEATVASLVASHAQVYAWDDGESGRDALKARFGKQVKLLPPAQWPWADMKAMALSPGIPLTHPAPHPVVNLARKNNCPVIGDVELLAVACPDATLVGITGTNGKSTTTTLIAHVLKEAGMNVQVGGNLGTPALALEPLAGGGVYVIETSSYQLDLLKTARFNVAVLLNVTSDHLDRHGDMQGYVAAKKHIFDRQTQADAAVIAVDDDYTRAVAGELKARAAAQVIEVSAVNELLQGVYAQDAVLHDRLEPGVEWQADLNGITTLTGRHNWQNAGVAYAVARFLGVDAGVVAKAFKSFPGLAHRLECIAVIGGVPFINDSKATNADATSNALAPYRNIYWILGGKPKSGGIETLAPYFPHVAHAFLIGEAEEEFAKTLDGKVKFTRSRTLEQAVKDAASKAWREKKEGAVVLLSPACASFDQFKNFEVRGDAFKEYVGRLSSVVGRETQHTTDDRQPTINETLHAS